MEELRERLFNAMREDLSVMAEHGDSEELLREELNKCNEEILEEYADTFLWIPFC